jgi:hypothetical protein
MSCRRLLLGVVSLCWLFTAVRATGQALPCVANEAEKLTASDGLGGDALGTSLAAHGNLLISGAPQSDDNGTSSGSVYVYRRTGTDWGEETKLTAFDAAANDAFGASAAVRGSLIVVGASTDDHSVNDAGSAYVYRHDGSSWQFEQKLTASDADVSDEFGVSVAVDTDVILVGAHKNDDMGNASGSAYLFRFDGTSWMEEQKITASDGIFDMRLGHSVALSNDLAVLGAHGDDDVGAGAGALYAYLYDGTAWAFEQKVMAGDGAAGDSFGWSVAADGDRILSGAFADGDLGIFSGSAYLFQWDGTQWNEETKLTASDGVLLDFYGQSVALQGELAAVGAPNANPVVSDEGAAYVYRLVGTRWVELMKSRASDAGVSDELGAAVAVSSHGAYSGSPGTLTDQGGVYRYETPGLHLTITPETIVLNDTVTFRTCGGALGKLVTLFIVDIGGTPTFLHMPFFGFFNGSGAWTFGGPLQSGPGVIDIGFASLGVNGELILSNTAVASFQ